MCAYALAFENVLDVVRVVLVRGRGDSAEARKFALHSNALQKVPIVEEAPEEVRDVELPAVYVQVRTLRSLWKKSLPYYELYIPYIDTG